MEACYGGTEVMERSCAVARGKDINTTTPPIILMLILYPGPLAQKPALCYDVNLNAPALQQRASHFAISTRHYECPCAPRISVAWARLRFRPLYKMTITTALSKYYRRS
jgi:hypothetical protein